MRKIYAMTAVAALTLTSVASAQDSRLLFTVANQGGWTGAGALFAASTNHTLYLAPISQNSSLSGNPVFGGATAYHTGSLSLRMTVGTKGGGCGDEAISSVGINIDVTGGAGSSAPALTTSYLANNTAGSVGSQNAPWSGVNPAGATAGAPDVNDIRKVLVPSSSASAAWLGLGPTPTCTAGGALSSYNLATLSVTASNLSAGQASYPVFLQVGPLKVTRAYDPAGTQGTQPEMVAFGFGDAAVNGSSNTAVASSTADATIIVRKKGDYGIVDPNTGGLLDSNPDGIVSTDETNYHGTTVGSSIPLEVFLGDYGVADPNTGNLITNVPDGVVSVDETNVHASTVGS